MFQRSLFKQLIKFSFKGKAIFILGARQTGKTTLAKEMLKYFQKNGSKIKVFNCDDPKSRNYLDNRGLEFLIDIIGDCDTILVDEGQKVETIGQTIKLLVDHFGKKKQIIVTGSSSFNLLDKTEEVLTGRKYIFHLYPLSLEEIHPDRDLLSVNNNLENYLIYGSYPEVINKKSSEEKKKILEEITTSYLYKDILEFQKIKNSSILFNLLKALSLQVGSEVSYTELATLIGIDKNTVEKYIDLLEKNFIIFRLPPFFSNKRREIAKMRKIYFHDLGVRNMIINNLNPLSDRNDVGSLWENLLLTRD